MCGCGVHAPAGAQVRMCAPAGACAQVRRTWRTALKINDLMPHGMAHGMPHTMPHNAQSGARRSVIAVSLVDADGAVEAVDALAEPGAFVFARGHVAATEVEHAVRAFEGAHGVEVALAGAAHAGL